MFAGGGTKMVHNSVPAHRICHDTAIVLPLRMIREFVCMYVCVIALRIIREFVYMYVCVCMYVCMRTHVEDDP
jgi:hypothetical protein